MNKKVLDTAHVMIADFLRQRREELGISQQELADACGFHRNTIINTEAAKFWPNMKQYLVICHHLRCFPFLVTYEDNSEYGKLTRMHWTPGKPGESMINPENPN